jgi:hypothetical protein
MNQEKQISKFEQFQIEVRPHILKIMQITQKYVPLNDDDFEKLFEMVDSYVDEEELEEDEE